MAKHLQREIENLKNKLLSLSAVVEQALYKASTAIQNRDSQIGREVIDNDLLIDDMEVEVEEDCLKILALHQPVAVDLRFIVALLKINNDLERIGDLAVNIAERSVFLAGSPQPNISFDFMKMAHKAQLMLKSSLDALVNFSSQLAGQVLADDDEIDAMNRQMFDKIEVAAKENPNQMQVLIHLLSVSRHLERIADLATNIAEDVIYMIEGRIVRHKTENYT